MALEVTTAPTTEPITTAEAKLHASVDSSADDALIGGLVTAARAWCEVFCRRTFPTTTYRYTLDAFPGACGAIEVPNPPLTSVTSITYIDTAGTSQTLSSANYTVDTRSAPGRIIPAYGLTWPSTRDTINAVTIVFVAGYGSSAMPQQVKLAMAMLVAHWYENRMAVEVGQGISTLTVPMAVESLLWNLRVRV